MMNYNAELYRPSLIQTLFSILMISLITTTEVTICNPVIHPFNGGGLLNVLS